MNRLIFKSAVFGSYYNRIIYQCTLCAHHCLPKLPSMAFQETLIVYRVNTFGPHPGAQHTILFPSVCLHLPTLSLPLRRLTSATGHATGNGMVLHSSVLGDSPSRCPLSCSFAEAKSTSISFVGCCSTFALAYSIGLLSISSSRCRIYHIHTKSTRRSHTRHWCSTLLASVRLIKVLKLWSIGSLLTQTFHKRLFDEISIPV